jgi:hypothetical protein
MEVVMERKEKRDEGKKETNDDVRLVPINLRANGVMKH